MLPIAEPNTIVSFTYRPAVLSNTTTFVNALVSIATLEVIVPVTAAIVASYPV